MVPFTSEREFVELLALGVPAEALVRGAVTPDSDPAMDLVVVLEDTGHEAIFDTLKGLLLSNEAAVIEGLRSGNRRQIKHGIGSERWQSAIASTLEDHALATAEMVYDAVRDAYLPHEAHAKKAQPAGLADWIKKNVASRATGINAAGRNAIRAAVSKALASGRDVANVRTIKDAIGLTAQQLGTLEKYTAALKDEEAYTAAEVRALVEARREELLLARAKVIAREETSRAAAAAQKFAWAEMAREGKIDKSWEKEWVAEGDNPCPVCEDLDGEVVGIDELFETEGETFEAPPEPHIHCQCQVYLVRGGRHRLELHYDEDQPRDDAGRWSDGGGGGGAPGAAPSRLLQPGEVPKGPKTLKREKAKAARDAWNTERRDQAKAVWARNRAAFDARKRAAAGLPPKEPKAAAADPNRPGSGFAQPGGGDESRSPAERAMLGFSPSSADDLGGGINQTYKVTLENGQVGVFKPAAGEYGAVRVNVAAGFSVEREVGGWEVAKAVGFEDLVSPTVERTFPAGGNPLAQGRGSFQAWNDGKTGAAIGRVNRDDAYGKNKDDIFRAAAFDHVIGNTDRHPGNWMVSKATGRMKLIDHGLSFPERNRASGPQSRANVMLVEKAVRLEGNGILRVGKSFGAGVRFTALRDHMVSRRSAIANAMRKAGLGDASIAAMNQRVDHMAKSSSWKDLLDSPVPKR